MNYKLTSQQKLIESMDEYCENSVTSITGELTATENADEDLLKKAYNKIIEDIQTLRTRIGMDGDELFQFYAEYEYEDIPVISFKTEKEKNAFAEAEANKHVPLNGGKLYRSYILKCTETSQLSLLITLNHIIADAWTTYLLKREFTYYCKELLEGEVPQKTVLEYTNYIEKETEYHSSKRYQKDKKFWLNEFEGYEKQSMSVGNSLNSASKRISIDFTESQTKYFNELSLKLKTTPNNLMMSLILLYLHITERIKDVCIGSALYNRPDNDDKRTIGMMVNTAAFRYDFSEDIRFCDFVKSIEKKNISVFMHQKFNYGELLEELHKLNFTGSLYDIMFNFQIMPEGADRTGLKWHHCGNIDELMIMTLISCNDRYSMSYDFKTDCLSEKNILDINARLMRMIEQTNEDTNIMLSCVETLTQEERRIIMTQFNASKADYPKEKTISELFEEQVEKTPENTAVVFGEEKLTYRELNVRANILAHKLRKLGVHSDDIVAVISERSIEMISAIIGIIKSGAAYVPVDPAYPEERIGFIVADSKPKAVLKYTDEIIHFPDEIPVLDLSDNNTWTGPDFNPEYINKPSDIMYCIYTSGTTGKPKGVAVTEKTIVNLVSDEYRRMDDSAFTRTLFATNYAFDVSVQEYFSTLLCGGSGYIITYDDKQDTQKCARHISNYKIDTLFATPSYFEALSEDNKFAVIDNVKHVILAGEAFRISDLFINEDAASDIMIYNHYGPTETHVVTINQKSAAQLRENNQLNIGVPVSNTEIYIVNSNTMCPIGVAGELCIAGDGLARGYLNRPDITNEKFADNPFGDGRMYRSGDLAKWLPDGTIEYLGRIDEQVKIRGFRIELGEIESRLRQIDNIKDCAVIAKTDNKGDKAIYAYYTSEEIISIVTIRDILTQYLPEYMIPAYMMQIKVIPMTRNGKLDRRALPEIESRTTREYIPPENDTQEKICRLFSEILDVEKVGIKDSFFELGGHSLRATRLVNRMEAETGTRIALKEVFTHPTPEQLAQLIQDTSDEKYIPIPVAQKKDLYMMAPSQKRIFMLQQMYPESTSYNLPVLIKINAKADYNHICDVMQKLVDKHEILRSSYLFEQEEAMYKINDNLKITVEHEKTDVINEQQLLKAFVKPFDLTRAPLIHIKLVDSKENSVLLFDIHHIISDGISENLLINEFNTLYSKMDDVYQSREYKDYSEWMYSRDLRSQREYWIERFSDDIPMISLPEDHPRTVDSKHNGAYLVREINESLSSKISKTARTTGTTEYMVFLACLMITLSKYSRQEDIVIGSPISGRTHRDTEKMLGMFVNTLAMRGKPEGKKTFTEFLSEIRETCFKAYENQEYPFDELVEKLEIKHDPLHNPLFDVMLTFLNTEQADLRIDGNQLDIVLTQENTAKFDLTIEISKKHNIYKINTEYCSDIFNSDTVKNIIEHLLTIIDEVTQSPDIKIEKINCLTGYDMDIWNRYNNSDESIPYDSLENIVSSQCIRTPDRVAVICGDKSVTYGELWRKSQKIAGFLHSRGYGRNDSISVSGERCIETIINIIGILAAGCIYVPENPDYPDSRNSYISKNSNCKMRLCADSFEKLDIESCDCFCCTGDPDSVAYTIYTSGSTGVPKGVVIKHHAAVNTILDINAKFRVTENDMFILLSAFSFDLSVYDIFGALSTGAGIVIVENQKNPTEIKEILSKYPITMWNSVPAIMSMYLIGEGVGCDTLKNVLHSGDWISVDLPDKIHSVFPNASVTSLGGATEASIWSIYYPVKDIPENIKSIPYGMPLANQKMLLLNNAGKLLPVGAVGEICIAGQGLSEGYANQPDKTAAAFRNHECYGRVYHTGDIGRMHEQGFIEFMGRMDDQVKIRGFRIELGEIENKLRQIDNVRDCAVIVRDDQNGEKALYAYYTCDTQIDKNYIKNCLRQSLPEYMIPSMMMQIDSIPVTKNGKIDKKSLPQIVSSSDKENVKPRNEIEEKLLEIYKQVINNEDISVTENFFDMGGNSLKIMQIFSKLGQIYPDCVKVVDLFANPSIEQLAVFIENKMSGDKKTDIKGVKLPEDFFGDFGTENEKTERTVDVTEYNSIKEEMSDDLFAFMTASYILLLNKLSGENIITVQCLEESSQKIHQITEDLSDTDNFFDVVENVKNQLCSDSSEYSLGGYVKPVFDNAQTITTLIVNGKIKYEYAEMFDVIIGINASDSLEIECDSHHRSLRFSALSDIMDAYSGIISALTQML